MNDEETQPPVARKPNTPRTWLLKAWEAVKAHPDRALCLVLGFLAGAILI